MRPSVSLRKKICRIIRRSIAMVDFETWLFAGDKIYPVFREMDIPVEVQLGTFSILATISANYQSTFSI